MSNVERYSTTGMAVKGDAAAQGRGCRTRRLPALVAAALALVLGLTAQVVVVSRPAGADQVSSLQAQATQLAQRMIRQQLQVGGLQQQYSAATEKVQELGQQITRAQQAVERDQRQVHHDVRRLRSAALFQYITSGTTSGNSSSALFSPDQRRAEAQGVYDALVAGNVTTALARLHADQANLHQQQASLQQAQGQAQAEQQQASQLLSQSQQVENQLAANQAQVKGQLAVAIQQQQAAQAAAAAAAIRAAQQQAAEQAAAAQRAQVAQAQQAPAPQAATQQAPQAATQQASQATPVPVTTSTAPPPATITANAAPVTAAPAASSGPAPALNGFLQCVLQAESGGNYSVVSSNGQYMGGFQFSQATWNMAAQLAGMPNLVGVPPNQATPAQQDSLAVALYSADGSAPWYDPCTGH